MIGSPYTTKSGQMKPTFCAGGDVKAVYFAGLQKDSSLQSNFFREEYQLNHLIATQSPNMPQISIWDGVVMGGGVGLSVHGKYRVATENTVFAMPGMIRILIFDDAEYCAKIFPLHISISECNIGFFPDVGGTWWIPRLKLYDQWRTKTYVGGVGNYLALTGARLKGDDLLYAGIATHYVQSSRLEELKQSLIDATSLGDSDNGDVTSSNMEDCAAGVLTSFHDASIDVENSFLARNRNDIDYAFDGKDSIEEILISLESMGPDSQFGVSTLSSLKSFSPTSLKVTLEGLKRGAKAQSVGEALQMEFRMAMAFMREGSDFYEGIRAVLVDKNGKPKWNPTNSHEVTEDIVNSYFEHLGEDELCFTSKECANL